MISVSSVKRWLQKFSKEMVIERQGMRELELTETWRAGWHKTLAFCMHADKVKSGWIWVAVRERGCAGWSPGGHFPSSMDRLLTFWLAAGLTLPVHHWALSIPQHLETAHKFKGPSMKSASQHPLKGLHRVAIKKNSSISPTLISSLAKSRRNKWLGTLCSGEDAECWQALSK